MANDCSRYWHLSDDQILTHFNSVYPQPSSWELLTLQPLIHSALISALSRQAAIQSSIVSGRTMAMDKHWQLWLDFTESFNLDSSLSGICDPVPFLQVFAT